MQQAEPIELATRHLYLETPDSELLQFCLLSRWSLKVVEALSCQPAVLFLRQTQVDVPKAEGPGPAREKIVHTGPGARRIGTSV